MKIEKQLVKKSLRGRVSYSTKNSVRYIVIHETANKGKGADAQAHANIQKNGNNRDASWHYQVDDKRIIQSFPVTVSCWHAGSAVYNKNSIGIEICVNSDSDFKKAVKNASELIKKLMKKHNIPVKNVITHKETSGWKDCPHQLRSGKHSVTLTDLKKWIGSKTPIKVTETTTKPTHSNTGITDTKSIVDYLKQRNIDSSSTNRKKLAKKYGVKGYDMSAKKNTELLNAMKKEEKGTKPSKKDKPKTTTKKVKKYKNVGGNSLVDFLKGNKVSSTMKNREKLAKKYGIKNYSGTAKQNTKLLKAMKKDTKKVTTSKKQNKTNTGSFKGKSVKSKVNGLRFYNKPSWKDKDVVGSVGKGIGFPTIVKKVKVDSAYQYKVKNSKGNIYYITASSKYVTVK